MLIRSRRRRNCRAAESAQGGCVAKLGLAQSAGLWSGRCSSHSSIRLPTTPQPVLITGGAQDVGISQQLSGTKEEWTQGLPRTKEDRRSGGDGGVVQLIQGTPSQYYLSANSLGGFRVLPINYSGSPPAVIVGDPTFLPGRIVGGAAGATLFGLHGCSRTAIPHIVRRQSIQPVAHPGCRRARPLRDASTAARRSGTSIQAQARAPSRALAYGGFDSTAGANRGDIIVAAQGNTIWFRPPGVAAFQSVAAPNPGFAIVDLVLNPSDFRSGYAVARDSNKTTPDKVYHFVLNPTTPAMSSVVDVTNNLKDGRSAHGRDGARHERRR